MRYAPMDPNISQIIKEIRANNDYKSAAKILLDNDISLRKIMENTLKLNIFDIAKLADAAKLQV